MAKDMDNEMETGFRGVYRDCKLRKAEQLLTCF